MTSARILASAAAMALCLGCAEPKVGTTIESGSALEKVRMNLHSAIMYAPAVIAKEEGYFAEEGIDLELVNVDASSALLSMTSGALDVIGTPVRSGLFNLIVRGVPFQIVADDEHFAAGPCASTAFTAPPGLAARVRTNGLRGQRVATIKGGITEYMADRLLASQNLTRADVELVEYPPGEAATGELRVLEAVRFNFEPTITVQMEQGLIEIVAPAHEVAPGFQKNVIAFGERLLDENTDLGLRFMRAWLRGVRRYNEGKTERNVEIISGYTKLPTDLIRRVCWPHISNDGRIDPDAVQPLLDWMLEKGYLEAEVPLSTWWNPSFVDAANRDLAEREGAKPPEIVQ